MNPLTMFF